MNLIKSNYDFPTPALVIDLKQLKNNLSFMQGRANAFGVSLRPHTKTHKCPEIAKMQLYEGCHGITVAKTGEAEVMAEHGIDDIFIANQIIGADKLERVKILNRKTKLAIGLDSIYGIEAIESAFADEEKALDVLIELDTGEGRAGISTKNQLIEILQSLKTCKKTKLRGIFCHEGHSYAANDMSVCLEICASTQVMMLEYAKIIRSHGFELPVISIGATPDLMQCESIMPGITEVRPGTYPYMDAMQANALGSFERCAATVLVQVISKPSDERVIIDAGAKTLTMQATDMGICKTEGKGRVKGYPDAHIDDMYDEHGIFNNKAFHDAVSIGDKLEIIPNHICPVVNLFDFCYLVEDGKLVKTLDIACRGKIV